MVTNRFSHRSNRGQLLLISAISIAFIILGVVVVFNGLLYTQTASTGSTSTEISQAEDVEYELESGVQDLAREDFDGDIDDLVDAIQDEETDIEDLLRDEDEWQDVLTSYTESYQEVAGSSRPISVDVTQKEDIAGGISIEKASGVETDGNGDIVYETDDPRFGYIFDLVLSYDNPPVGDETILEIEEKDEPEKELEIDVQGNGLEFIFDGQSICEIDEIQPSQENFNIDLVDQILVITDEGDEYECPENEIVIDSDKQYNKITAEEVPASGFDIEYEIVGIGEVSDEEPDVTLPFTLEVTYTYQSSDISLEQTTEIELYDIDT